MKKYVVNKVEDNEHIYLITLLDYQTLITKSLKTLKLTLIGNNKKILIDAAIYSGMNEYRFIEATLTNEGTINFKNYKYVSIDERKLEFANKILKNNPLFLKTSILSNAKIREILQA
ncbi:Uncharacterised protein [Metamycoplasma arthritidis]|uniref:Uncharacterized protein n=1 Tax=Metamycoplasma arthritidis (strain 158L3-1) TaxID=243272 RepID=B3PN27_META1|nr:type II toxin-antitoxin system RnlB family antitoxin [Metamycoplasma arthritidis]ACF07429.1 very hypothetical protein [Metamycoplasma arthritidis 158L3-1]VEU78951.1 Uncharacterised protein [Metamycoplasma arthritidis]